MISRGLVGGPFASLMAVALLLSACSSSSSGQDPSSDSALASPSASAPETASDSTILLGPVVPDLPVAGPAVGLGDDADLDRLAAQCELGVVIGCDMLAAVSPPGSEYQAYAFSCGGRTTASMSCAVDYADIEVSTAAFEGEALPDAGPPPAGEGGALDRLARDCRDEDLLACDVLQFRAEPGSVHQAYASSCGARVDEPVVCTVWFRFVDPALVASPRNEPAS